MFLQEVILAKKVFDVSCRVPRKTSSGVIFFNRHSVFFYHIFQFYNNAQLFSQIYPSARQFLSLNRYGNIEPLIQLKGCFLQLFLQMNKNYSPLNVLFDNYVKADFGKRNWQGRNKSFFFRIIGICNKKVRDVT